MDEKIAEIYADCHHTKYVGCSPCPHDLAVRELEAAAAPDLER